jgi:hypothetical protein
MRGSRRIAPQNPDLPIQSFLAIEPFEVRHEALIRLERIAARIGLEESGHLEIDSQREVAQRVADFVVARTEVRIDGETTPPLMDRVDFMTVGKQGALPRRVPVREAIDTAMIGATIVYPTKRTAGEVSMAWMPFPEGMRTVPATVVDPESSRTTTLTIQEPVLRWVNELMEDPVPTLTAVEIVPTRLPVPLVSLPLLAVAVFWLAASFRGKPTTLSFALSRVLLALAFVAAPLANVPVAVPGNAGSVPSEGQARRILAGLLPNVYRALEFRDESTAYDRLAVSVTGDTLTDVYLDHRRALEMEERGGARARVEAVEVLEVEGVEPEADGGFRADASWTVGGTVTHFGHRHFRQNRYDASVVVVAVDGNWRIRAVEILEEKRLK